MHSVRPTQRFSRHFRQAYGLHFAFFHQSAQFSHTVFNRHVEVAAMQVVEINDVGFQTLQRSFASFTDTARRATDEALAFRTFDNAALAGQYELLAPWTQHATEQFLVLAEAIQISAVEKVVAKVERCGQRALGFHRFRRAVRMRHAHTAKADGVDGEVG